MPRRPNLNPTERMHVRLPADLAQKVELLLFSDLEGRVPYGAYQAFITQRLVEFFEDKPLDLGPYLGTLPGEAVVRGKTGVVHKLMTHLKEKS